ncbi:MAG: hypothetical protein J5495_04215 [Bacteroidales bacterium]|nr:hypothetical protein [Bacteroidales bacterium]
MKRFAAIFAASLLILVTSCPSGWCQKYERSIPNGELNISYGVFNIGEFALTFGQILGAAFTLGHYSPQNMYFTGAIGVEGYFRATDWLYIGGIVGYEHMGGDEYTKSGTVTHDDGTTETQYEYKGKLAIDMLMPMVSLKPFWFNHKKVSMYSKVAAGAFFILPSGDNSTETSFGFQVSPVGIEFGRSWRGFAELGFGMQGIINFGLCKRF